MGVRDWLFRSDGQVESESYWSFRVLIEERSRRELMGVCQSAVCGPAHVSHPGV